MNGLIFGNFGLLDYSGQSWLICNASWNEVKVDKQHKDRDSSHIKKCVNKLSFWWLATLPKPSFILTDFSLIDRFKA